MNKDEFKTKALQVLVLADQLEVLQGGELDTYTGKMALFQVVRRTTGLPNCSFVAQVWDTDYTDTFCSAYGESEDQAIDALCECLRAGAKAAEAFESGEPLGFGKF